VEGTGSKEGYRIFGKGKQKDLSDYEICGSVVVKAQCYKPEGRGFDTR
jgi:hypothetical protein